MIDQSRELARITSKKRVKTQTTPYQAKAEETATKLGKPRKTAAYARIFMEYGVVEDKIEECVVWVLN